MAKWTPTHEAPEPLEGPVVPTIVGGTLIWFVLFLVQLPFYGWFDDHGHLWWVWTCLAGAGLGLIGIWYVLRRDAAIRRATGEPGPDAEPGTGSSTDTGTGSGSGPDSGTDGGAAPGGSGTPDTGTGSAGDPAP